MAETVPELAPPWVQRLAPFAAVGAVFVAFVTVAAVQLGGKAPAAPIEETVSRVLRFSDSADGSVLVRDAADGRLLEALPPGSNGFVRGVLRGLHRERKLDDMGRETPFRLASRVDGHLVLTDLATGRVIDLGAFGPTNAESFARLLTAEGPRP